MSALAPPVGGNARTLYLKVDANGGVVFVKWPETCAARAKSFLTVTHHVTSKWRKFVSPDIIAQEV